MIVAKMFWWMVGLLICAMQKRLNQFPRIVDGTLQSLMTVDDWLIDWLIDSVPTRKNVVISLCQDFNDEWWSYFLVSYRPHCVVSDAIIYSNVISIRACYHVFCFLKSKRENSLFCEMYNQWLHSLFFQIIALVFASLSTYKYTYRFKAQYFRCCVLT